MKLYDKDFNHVYTFADGEAEKYKDGLPLDHPVAEHVKQCISRLEPGCVLVSDIDGIRRIRRLSWYTITPEDKMIVHWYDF